MPETKLHRGASVSEASKEKIKAIEAQNLIEEEPEKEDGSCEDVKPRGAGGESEIAEGTAGASASDKPQTDAGKSESAEKATALQSSAQKVEASDEGEAAQSKRTQEQEAGDASAVQESVLD